MALLFAKTSPKRSGSIEAAVEQLDCATLPVLLRLTISHYCRKAEFALTHARISYRAIDVPLARMKQVRRANPVRRTVPLLAYGRVLYQDSHAIVRWCDDHRRPGVPSFYPDEIQQEVLDFEHWTDQQLGPQVRRHAYRVLAKDPASYGRTATARVGLRLKRPIFRFVAGYLKVDEHAQEDETAMLQAIETIGSRLAQAPSGLLFTTHVTGADLATAALMEPMVPIAHIWGYDEHEHWPKIVDFVKAVRPSPVKATASRRVKEKDWQAFEALNQGQATLKRPTAAEYD